MNEVRRHYESEVDRLDRKIDEKNRIHRIIVVLRPIFFFPALIFLLAAYTRVDAPGFVIWIGWSIAALFLVLLIWHESIRTQMESFQVRRQIYKRLKGRLDRKWDEIPFRFHPASKLDEFRTPLMEDLDVFGERSLFHWVCLASSSIGQRRLAQWLSEWSTVDTMEARQQAVLELRDQRALREEILYIAAKLSNAHSTPEGFTEWAASDNWLKKHRITHLLSWLGPCIIALGVGWFVASKMLDVISMQWFGLILVAVGLAGNILLMLGKVGAIHDIFQSINSGHREVDGYRDLYRVMSRLNGESKMVRHIRETSSIGPLSANRGFDRMRVLVMLANLQRNSLFYIPYILLQIIVQWDFRIMEFLERWKREFGGRVKVWLEALAECEALVSVATVAEESPNWAFPKWTKGQMPLIVEGMGHPLLTDAKRVNNSLSIARDHPLLLITGSNMAGKSTLLRSLGLNILLARTGSPVTAARFEIEPFELATSMRIQDSLQDGVSFFMAELYRLRSIVDQARNELGKSDTGRPLLALLDEILQGTNSRERQIAVLHVVKQLIDFGAITAISTHDLELADREDMQKIAQIVHFREYFAEVNGKEEMRFDYIMRPGPTPTTNALKLLELVGLKPVEPPKST